ncbi:hypothetical protein MXB_4626 [Myxobolus squamalis]|nr:hypothetical protein MXB_4626 [Myxobolus squamalis]
MRMYVKTFQKKAEMNFRHFDRISFDNLNEKWSNWLLKPNPREFFEILRDTLAVISVRTCQFALSSIKMIDEFTTPRSESIYSEYIQPYAMFNPYSHTGRDSLSLYIQTMILSTLAIMLIPILILFFRLTTIGLFLISIAPFYLFGGVFNLYRLALLFFSIIVVSTHFLLMNPSFIPLLVLAYFFILKSGSDDNLQAEIASIRTEIIVLSKRMDLFESERPINKRKI